MVSTEKKDEFLSETRKLYSLRDGRPVELTSELRKDLNTTSMQYFAMLGTIEELCGKNIGYDVIKSCATIADVAALMD